MRNLLLIATFVFCSFFSFSQSLSPEVISTGGDYFDNGSVSLSWTIGECVIETFQGSTAILTQGFQQSKLTITQVENVEMIPFDCFVYPNPVKDVINIDLQGADKMKLMLEIYDMNGKTVIQQNIDREITTIDFGQYQSATYIMKIHDKSGEISNTYQIIKAN